MMKEMECPIHIFHKNYAKQEYWQDGDAYIYRGMRHEF